MKKSLLILSLIYITGVVHAGDSSIAVEQIGSNNTIEIVQDGTEHSVTINTGSTSDVDNTYIVITQQGTGAKTASVNINSGINNSVNILQDGAGNHVTAIQNLNGSANNITSNQTGSGNHNFAIIGQTGTTNSGNTIESTQSGSGDKSFELTLGGSSGATVNLQQTHPTQSNTGSMTIQCNPCGAYSYTRN